MNCNLVSRERFGAVSGAQTDSLGKSPLRKQTKKESKQWQRYPQTVLTPRLASSLSP
jgi:hypothetical protein